MYPDTYYEAVIQCRRHYSAKVYRHMLNMGKETWWREHGQPKSSYRKFIGEGNFQLMMDDFRYFEEHGLDEFPDTVTTRRTYDFG